MSTYTLRPREGLPAHVAAVSVDVLAGTSAVDCPQVLGQFAGTRKRRRTSPTAATSFWAVGRGRSVMRALMMTQTLTLPV